MGSEKGKGIKLEEIVDKKLELEEALEREKEAFVAKVNELGTAFEKETGACIKKPIIGDLFLSAITVEIDFEKTKEIMKGRKAG